jgi:dihydrofolate reductase
MKIRPAGLPTAAGRFLTATRTSVPPGDELQVHGSDLAQTLIEHDLIDEYRLLYFPVHLGSGKKLFTDGARAAALRLISTSVTGTGVIIASYAPAGPPRHGSYALPSEP